MKNLFQIVENVNIKQGGNNAYHPHDTLLLNLQNEVSKGKERPNNLYNNFTKHH
jgi:hypothetical protein